MTTEFPFKVGDILKNNHYSEITFDKCPSKVYCAVKVSPEEHITLLDFTRTADGAYHPRDHYCGVTYRAKFLHKDFLIERRAPVECWTDWFIKVSV